MSKRILLQLDCDHLPSSFDSVVAVDAGVDHLLTYGDVQTTTVTGLIHGAMFTRGGNNLKNTAVFIGGSDVGNAEDVMNAAVAAFFGNIRVSLMLDANGCNTTASAAVVAAGRHVDLSGARAVVLGGTGPVGRRVARLLAGDGAAVTLTSRSIERAEKACAEIQAQLPEAQFAGAAPSTPAEIGATLDGAQIVIACGAAGYELVNEATIRAVSSLKVAIDLNAVPPAGIGGVGVTDQAAALGDAVVYGAIGVGGLKMKTHKAAIQSLFESNDKVLDAAEIYAIAKEIG
ncbi:NADP-dependent methylenetetrahydromethanopterin/methylenetetrahydrofolate dehydrogenase [Planctomycetes bacterium K23_9]|uniref:Bifunctional protein MdtA n=1 Tax=Stieleria marina TaxID=1930275 RepID=A0A517NVX8_9BACT|nr:Bifunctional protein MdtA [Planctomycetes bacterium K23_9]